MIASGFVSPCLLLLTISGDVIWCPGSTESNFFRFSPLDDVVMGGASESTFDNNTGIWKGTVTSVNNGGFVGIRSNPFAQPLDMESCTGLEIKLRGGDGKRFKGTVRDSTDFNGICWTTSFDTGSSFSPLNLWNGGDQSGIVGTVKLPFNKQIPTIFARTVPDQVFRSDNVQGIQFAYSKVSS